MMSSHSNGNASLINELPDVDIHNELLPFDVLKVVCGICQFHSGDCLIGLYTGQSFKSQEFYDILCRKVESVFG